MDSFELSDTDLVIKAKNDPNAFGQLYDRYIDRIYAYTACRLMHREEAEDVTSEIWLKVLKALPAFRPKREESVVAWLFAIARNSVHDAHRRLRHIESLDTDEVTVIESNHEHPSHSIDCKKSFMRITSALDTLPRQQAHCLRLRFFGGLKNVEISELENMREKTVAAHISRGLQAIRLQISPEDNPFFEITSSPSHL